MKQAQVIQAVMPAEFEQTIAETARKESGRLLSFIRKRVPSEDDARDILQDVFYQLVESYRLMKPVEHMTSWLFTVARNKITDSYRKKKTESLEEHYAFAGSDEEGEGYVLSDLLSDLGEGADAGLMRDLIMERIEEALDELPEEQREVFVMHEIEDKSFKEISDLTGASVNTLLSRKRYAILQLRESLKDLYNEVNN